MGVFKTLAVVGISIVGLSLAACQKAEEKLLLLHQAILI